MEMMKPMNTVLDFNIGVLNPEGVKITRTLSQLEGVFKDNDSLREGIELEDNIVYEYYNVVIPEEEGHLQHCTTILYPGKVGNEYYMTKGHYHAKEGTSEIYMCIRGTGILLMQTKGGDVEALEMFPGTIGYIPPYWAHRVINTGDVPLVFFGVYPGDAGHNYEDIAKNGFLQRVIDDNGPKRVEA